MKDCIFCKIINDELPSKTIYEDDLIKVIMNIDPATNGHLLVLPKNHFENILDTPEEIPLLKEKLNCKGLTIAENNFLGQEIKHFHIHLVPRYDNDLVKFNYNKDQVDDLDEVFSKLA